MNHSPITVGKILPALAVACALAAFSSPAIAKKNKNVAAGANFAASDTKNGKAIGLNTKVKSVTINIPAKGTVIVASSGYAVGTDPDTDIECSLTKGNALEKVSVIVSVGIEDFANIAETRGFTYNNKGKKTINLVCSVLENGAGLIFDSSLTAIWVPERLK